MDSYLCLVKPSINTSSSNLNISTTTLMKPDASKSIQAPPNTPLLDPNQKKVDGFNDKLLSPMPRTLKNNTNSSHSHHRKTSSHY